MKADLKNKWIEALTSGKYTQARGHLRKSVQRDVKGYCCLGVLCEVMNMERTDFGYKMPSSEGFMMDKAGQLTPFVCRNIGLSEMQMGQLINKNDGGAKFAEIAEWIKENVSEEEA